MYPLKNIFLDKQSLLLLLQEEKSSIIGQRESKPGRHRTTPLSRSSSNWKVVNLEEEEEEEEEEDGADEDEEGEGDDVDNGRGDCGSLL